MLVKIFISIIVAIVVANFYWLVIKPNNDKIERIFFVFAVSYVLYPIIGSIIMMV